MLEDVAAAAVRGAQAVVWLTVSMLLLVAAVWLVRRLEDGRVRLLALLLVLPPVLALLVVCVVELTSLFC
ncbi:MAG: hypothetical protein QXG57_08815 [Thermofilaceae archaeon]